MKYSQIAPPRWPGFSPGHRPGRRHWPAAPGLLLALLLGPLMAWPLRAGVRTLNDSNPTAAKSAPLPITPAPAGHNASATQSTQPIPYPPGPFFATNRVGDPDVKLPPLPSFLYPIPPAERRPYPVLLPRPGLVDTPVVHTTAKVPANGNASTGKSSLDASGNVVVGTFDTPEQNIAISPFITWINKTPNAADVARQAQESYNASGVVDTNPNNADLFYNIRFPYTGSEQTPPGTGAVIYTTPKH